MQPKGNKPGALCCHAVGDRDDVGVHHRILADSTRWCLRHLPFVARPHVSRSIMGRRCSAMCVVRRGVELCLRRTAPGTAPDPACVRTSRLRRHRGAHVQCRCLRMTILTVSRLPDIPAGCSRRCHRLVARMDSLATRETSCTMVRYAARPMYTRYVASLSHLGSS